MPVEQRSEYLTWSARDGGAVVHIGSAVVERLNRDIKRGLGATRRRGTELGGLLLGRVEKRGTTDIWVDDYHLVPCEYAFGPSYVLSSADEVGFGQAITSWSPAPGAATYAVGYFRSHTREGLGLAPPDVELFARYITSPAAVALIVKPFATRASIASFFVPVYGRLDASTPADEFTFAPSGGGEHEDAEAVPLPVVTPAPEPVAQEPAKPAPVRVAQAPTEAERVLSNVLGPRTATDAPAGAGTRYERPLFADYAEKPATSVRVLSWSLFLAAVLLFGGLAGYQYAGGQIPWLSTPAAAPAEDMFAIGLTAEQQGSDLLVRWNRDAVAVEKAQGGVLVIQEASGAREVKLGFSELRNGTVMYKHIAPEVTFRLELALGGNRQLIESFTWKQAEQAP